ncbi:unnamed protein product, partial [Choristocarpus tenellus]
MILFSKMPAIFKIRALFDVFDLDGDRTLNRCECIIMFRSILHAVYKTTRGTEPVPTTSSYLEHSINVGISTDFAQISYSKWISFCQKERMVHCIGQLLDFKKAPCRKALLTGTSVNLPDIGVDGTDPAVCVQRGATVNKCWAGVMRKRRAAAARDGKSKYCRSTVMEIKEV